MKDATINLLCGKDCLLTATTCNALTRNSRFCRACCSSRRSTNKPNYRKRNVQMCKFPRNSRHLCCMHHQTLRLEQRCSICGNVSKNDKLKKRYSLAKTVKWKCDTTQCYTTCLPHIGEAACVLHTPGAQQSALDWQLASGVTQHTP